jgi:proteasome lid subunit RPN8/RPN11
MNNTSIQRTFGYTSVAATPRVDVAGNQFALDARVAQRFNAYAMVAYPNEIGGLLRIQTQADGSYRAIDLMVFEQEVTGAYFELDGVAVAKFNMQLVREGRKDEIAEWKSLIHSHPSMTPFMSGTDRENIERLAGNGFAFSVICSAQPNPERNYYAVHYAQGGPVPMIVHNLTVGVDSGADLSGVDLLDAIELKRISEEVRELCSEIALTATSQLPPVTAEGAFGVVAFSDDDDIWLDSSSLSDDEYQLIDEILQRRRVGRHDLDELIEKLSQSQALNHEEAELLIFELDHYIQLAHLDNDDDFGLNDSAVVECQILSADLEAALERPLPLTEAVEDQLGLLADPTPNPTPAPIAAASLRYRHALVLDARQEQLLRDLLNQTFTTEHEQTLAAATAAASPDYALNRHELLFVAGLLEHHQQTADESTSDMIAAIIQCLPTIPVLAGDPLQIMEKRLIRDRLAARKLVIGQSLYEETLSSLDHDLSARSRTLIRSLMESCELESETNPGDAALAHAVLVKLSDEAALPTTITRQPFHELLLYNDELQPVYDALEARIAHLSATDDDHGTELDQLENVLQAVASLRTQTAPSPTTVMTQSQLIHQAIDQVLDSRPLSEQQALTVLSTRLDAGQPLDAADRHRLVTTLALAQRQLNEQTPQHTAIGQLISDLSAERTQ